VGERQVRDYAKRLGRPSKRPRVGTDDVRSGAAQDVGTPWIQLDGDDAACASDQLAGDDAVAGPDFDDEIAACDAGVANEVSREPRREVVPAPREWTSALRVHG
jgi:hypothetical protein